MLSVTRDLVLPTAITGSYPRPLWFDASLGGRSFKTALGDSMFREQYMDAVACIINAQEAAGLDIVTDGDSRFDLAVGGKSWFFYPIERLGGIDGHRDTSRGWMQRHGLRPGRILWEVQEAYQPGVVKDRLTRGPLEYAALWKIAQRLTDRPVKFGAICGPALASMLWNEYYRDDRELITDLCDIMNAEFRELAAAGCPLIQVEEPPHHGRTTRPDCTDADWSSSRRRSTASSWGWRPRSGCTRAGATPTSSASTGSRRATSARCPTCSASTPTSSPSSAPAATAAIWRSSASTGPTRRSASAW
jgi:5-methyltetrahydropteroyltriglutamate--homocysteine methyltransferase